MIFQFSFKHMETSEALQTYAEDKLRERIQKYVTKPIEAHVIFKVVRHEHIAHISLRAGDGFGIEVEHSCGDMYGSIDHVADKLASQLKKHKEKLKDHKGGKLINALNLDGEEVEASAPRVLETDAVVVDAGDIVKLEEKRRASAGG